MPDQLQQPLQGQVQKKISFQDVINQNPDGWAKETPEFKSNLADAFFAKHVATQPGFANESPDVQAEVRTQFNKQYNVGQLPDTGLMGNINKGLQTATLAAGSVTDPAISALTYGLVDSKKTAEDTAKKFYPGIQTDPGLLGDAYRLHQNPNLNAVGGALGAGGAVGGLTKTLGRYALPAYSAVSNGINVLKGNANPVQGVVQTGIDTLTGMIPGGKTLLGNVVKQAAGGAVGGLAGSVAGDITGGHAVDWHKAMEETIRQALIGGGMAGGHHLAEHFTPYQKPMQVRGVDRAQSVGVHVPGQPYNVRTEAGQTSERIRQAVQSKLDQTGRHQSVSEAKTLKAKIDALKKQYENLSQVANNPMAHPNVQRNAKLIQGKILEVHNQLSKQYQQQFGKSGTREKQSLDHAGQDFHNVVALVKDMRAKGNTKQANVMLNAFQPETKAKIYDEVHRQEQAEKTTAPRATKPVNGTPVADVLLDALKSAAEKPALKGEVHTEYRAPGPDEYTRMAKENGVTKATVAKAEGDGKVVKGKVTKEGKGTKTEKAAKVKSEAQKSKENRQTIEETLQVLRRNSDWAEQPAKDFLDRHDIPHSESDKLSVLGYKISVPFKKSVHFKYNAPIGDVLDKVGITAMASKVNGNSTVDAIRAELHDQHFNEDNYTGDPHQFIGQLEKDALDRYHAQDAAENAYYNRVDHNMAEARQAMEHATTLEDLTRVVEHLDSEKFQDMPTEFFDTMYNEWQQHIDRIEHGEKVRSTQPEGSAGQNEERAGAGQGTAGQEQTSAGVPTKKDLMPIDTMRQVVKDAKAAGESVRIRYWAERTGETGEFHYKTLHDVRIIEGKNGKETKWTGINSDGQLHTYIERNNAGNLQDSNIISVEKTGQPNEFSRVLHPETGVPAVEHTESGELIPQISKTGVKSSALHAKMNELVTAVNEGKHVSVDRILNTAREFSKQKEVENQLESMSQQERAKLYEKITGKPC